LRGPDQIVADAVRRTATTDIYGDSMLESRLTGAIRRALENDKDVRLVSTEKKYKLPDWSRSPGGVDLIAQLRDGSLLLMEMKLGKPDEGIWDALKLADICLLKDGLPPFITYLLHDGEDRAWQSAKETVELYRDGERRWGAREMIESWPNAWLGLLVGGRGIRPRAGVGGIVTRMVTSTSLQAHDGRTIRVVGIEPDRSLERQDYDLDGWPLGFKPPQALRDSGRAADEALREPVILPIAPETDPCHGYPWFERWTVQRAVAAAADLSDDAYQCMRARLTTERNWSEGDLYPVDRARHRR
jgi:hypothetical protein